MDHLICSWMRKYYSKIWPEIFTVLYVVIVTLIHNSFNMIGQLCHKYFFSDKTFRRAFMFFRFFGVEIYEERLILRLPSDCFPKNYNFNLFKSRVCTWYFHLFQTLLIVLHIKFTTTIWTLTFCFQCLSSVVLDDFLYCKKNDLNFTAVLMQI